MPSEILSISLQFPIVVKEQAPVTSIHFSATSPHDFAVTSGSRVGPCYNQHD